MVQVGRPDENARPLSHWLTDGGLAHLPGYLYLFLSNQYGLKNLVERAMWELACNAEAVREARLHRSVRPYLGCLGFRVYRV